MLTKTLTIDTDGKPLTVTLDNIPEELDGIIKKCLEVINESISLNEFAKGETLNEDMKRTLMQHLEMAMYLGGVEVKRLKNLIQ